MCIYLKLCRTECLFRAQRLKSKDVCFPMKNKRPGRQKVHQIIEIAENNVCFRPLLHHFSDDKPKQIQGNKQLKTFQPARNLSHYHETSVEKLKNCTGNVVVPFLSCKF